MTTPTLPTPRYYTALDPYYYEVDNRPLVDLATRDEVVLENVEDVKNAQFVLSAAAGFIARGYTSANVAVGKLSFPGGLNMTIDRAFITQESLISDSDMRLYPRIGLAQNPETLSFTAPALNLFRTFTIQARVDYPDATLPFFDGTTSLSQTSTKVGRIIWSVKQNPVDQVDVENLVYPGADVGQIEVLRLTIPGGAGQVTLSQIQYVNFLLEGSLSQSNQSGGSTGPQYQYLHDRKTVTTATDTITGIAVNALYAFIFVDGVITFGADRNSVSSVTFDEVLPAGTVVDFITTVGGLAVAAEGTQDVQIFTAGPGGQTVFSGATVDTDSTIVFIQGLFQTPDRYVADSALSTITFTSPVPQGHQVVLLTLRGLPSAQATIPGGLGSQVLTKISNLANDFDWRDPLFTFPGGEPGQVLTKKSLTPNDFEWRSVATAHGQCLLTASGNNVVLQPFNGNLLVIDGTPQRIPQAGVSLNPAALPVGTYGVYAFFDTQIRLEATALTVSGYTQDAEGVYVKSTDPSRTLVGFFHLEVAGTLSYTGQKYFVRSWFNENSIMLSAAPQRDLAMNAFSPSQYKYIPGQIVQVLSIPGDTMAVTCNCTVTTSGSETANVALASNKLLGNIAFSLADVDASFGVNPSTTARSSTCISDVYSFPTVGINYVALYGNENTSTGQVLLTAKMKAIVSRG